MRRIRAFICSAMTIALSVDAAAQGRANEGAQPSRLFERLFRECAGCNRTGAVHMVMDAPRVTTAWLARHDWQSNGGSYGDNTVIAGFWYDAVHRRVFTRSLVLQEVNDPADLRLGRAPAGLLDDPDFTKELEPGTIVGLVGFERWSSNGFGSYFAAMQGAVRDTGTGFLDFATVTGENGRTRSGSTYSPEDLVRHLRLHPSGQFEIGYDTNPETRPDASLLVRGNVEVEGSLTVGGSPIVQPPDPPALSCSVRHATQRGRTASVACDEGRLATGGGGTCGRGEMRGSRPVLSSDAPVGWEITCSRDGSQEAFVICCAR